MLIKGWPLLLLFVLLLFQASELILHHVMQLPSHMLEVWPENARILHVAKTPWQVLSEKGYVHKCEHGPVTCTMYTINIEYSAPRVPNIVQ